MVDPNLRFSTRVGNYIKYRPGYPSTIINILQKDCQLCKSSIIADVGSGTGLLAQLFLKNSNVVFGIEPNKEMREAAKRFLRQYNTFKSISGSAEDTTLPAHSVDFVTAGHAFHWFDPHLARTEWLRILKPRGWAVLVWNERQKESTLLQAAYESLLLKHSAEYRDIPSHIEEQAILTLFGAVCFNRKVLENSQIFDFEGLKGRLLSSSYTPQPGHANFEPMMSELKKIFSEHEVNGKITYKYDTIVYYGHLESNVEQIERQPPKRESC